MAGNDRRKQILTATLELFHSRGFANVSTRDLAERAGLSRSHIYHYFKDWPILRREAFMQFATKQLAEARLEVEGLIPKEALRVFLHGCLPATRDSSFVLWLDAWDEALHDPALAQDYKAIDEQWEKFLAGIIEQGIKGGDFQCPSASRAARQLFALTMGYADHLLLNPSEEVARQSLEEVMEATRLLLLVR